MYTIMALIFTLNAISYCLKTLRTVFLAKDITKPVYLVVFVEAVVFATGFKMVTNGESFAFILAFAVGRVVGVWLGSYLEHKLAFGIMEVTVYSSNKQITKMADHLRDMGYSVMSQKCYGHRGKNEFLIRIMIVRKELPELEEVYDTFGYDDATFVVKELKDIGGLISPRRKKYDIIDD